MMRCTLTRCRWLYGAIKQAGVAGSTAANESCSGTSQLKLNHVSTLLSASGLQAQGAERTVLRHQASTWELLHVLFSAIEGEQAPGAAEGPAAMQEEEGEELHLDRLAAFKRRAALRCVLSLCSGCARGWA